MPWHMIIDQANAAAESNGRFFNKTNQFELILPQESANRFELRINMLYRLLYNTRAHCTVYDSVEIAAMFTQVYCLCNRSLRGTLMMFIS